MAKHLIFFYSFTVPVATFLTAVVCGTDKLKYDVFLNMVLVSVGVVVSSYGEIHFNVLGTAYQVMGMFGEALRLVLTQVLLQKKGLTLNPITSLYYIAPCRYLVLTYLEPLNYCSISEFDMLIQASMVLLLWFWNNTALLGLKPRVIGEFMNPLLQPGFF